MATNKEEKRFHGIAISSGIAIGKPFFFDDPIETLPEFSISGDEIGSEIKRYRTAINKSIMDIELLRDNYRKEDNKNIILDILNSHLEMLKDP